MKKVQKLPRHFYRFPRATGKVQEAIKRYQAGGTAEQLAVELLQLYNQYKKPSASRSSRITPKVKEQYEYKHRNRRV